MKKRSLTWKIVIGILSLSMILIPLTSSLSMAQGGAAAGSAAAGGAAGTGAAAGLSTAAIVGVSAAVVASITFLVTAANDKGEPPAAAVHH